MPHKKTPHDDHLTIEHSGGEPSGVNADPHSGHDPAPTRLRRKPAGKKADTYSLRLTQEQRISLIACTRIRFKKRLREAGAGTMVINITRKELDHLTDEIGSAVTFMPGPHKKRLMAALQKLDEAVASGREEPFGEEQFKTLKSAMVSGERIYQFKIRLLDIKPMI
jgi:hypothetical protein